MILKNRETENQIFDISTRYPFIPHRDETINRLSLSTRQPSNGCECHVGRDAVTSGQLMPRGRLLERKPHS